MVPHGARVLALDLLLVLALVEDLGEAVTRHEIVDRQVIGAFHVLLVQELEMHRRGLEAVAALEHRPPLDGPAVDERAVGRALVLEGHHRTGIAQLRVLARKGHHLRQAHRHRRRAPDLQHRAGRQPVPRPQPLRVRVGDQDDVGLRLRDRDAALDAFPRRGLERLRGGALLQSRQVDAIRIGLQFEPALAVGSLGRVIHESDVRRDLIVEAEGVVLTRAPERY